MKRTLYVVLGVIMFIMTSGVAFAQTGVAYGRNGAATWAVFLGAGLAIGFAALGTGIGMGRAIGSALEGVSRNPSVAPRIMTMMILGLALIESLAIYSLVVSILILFVI